MKKLSTLLFSLFLALCAYAQTAPGNPEIKTAEDCRKYAPQVKEAADWLIQTPLDGKPESEFKRLEASQLIILWMTGTPDVTFSLSDWFVDLSDKNVEMTGIIMASLASYAIGHDYNVDAAEMEKNAIKDAVAFYNGNLKYMKKNKKVAKYQDVR